MKTSETISLNIVNCSMSLICLSCSEFANINCFLYRFDKKFNVLVTWETLPDFSLICN